MSSSPSSPRRVYYSNSLRDQEQVKLEEGSSRTGFQMMILIIKPLWALRRTSDLGPLYSPDRLPTGFLNPLAPLLSHALDICLKRPG